MGFVNRVVESFKRPLVIVLRLAGAGYGKHA